MKNRKRVPMRIVVLVVSLLCQYGWAQVQGARRTEDPEGPPPMHEELLADEAAEGMAPPREGVRAFERRLERAVANEVITAEEAQRLRKQKAEVDAYREQIWKDGVMTRTERDALVKMTGDLHRAFEDVFRRAMERRREGMGTGNAFRRRIQDARAKGDITAEQAERLIALHQEVEKTRQAIWADDKMTRAERDELARKTGAFRAAVREVFHRDRPLEPRGADTPRRRPRE